MASSSTKSQNVRMESKEDKNENVPLWLLANEGIKMLINNNAKEAEELFSKYPDHLIMFAGHSFVVFMDALMSFDGEKLDLAISTLKEVEQRCSADSGWIKSFQKFFGSGNNATGPPTLADQLETQIILADSQVCIATLIFLQQDISGYLKGGWVLRKAWKVYQKVYKEILELYRKKIGELHLPDPMQSPVPATESEVVLMGSSGSLNGYLDPKSKIPHSQSDFCVKNHSSNSTFFSDNDSLQTDNNSFKNDSNSIENDSASIKNDNDSIESESHSAKNDSDSIKNDNNCIKIQSGDDCIKNINAQKRPNSVPQPSVLNQTSEKKSRPKTLKLKKSKTINNALSERTSKQRNSWGMNRFSPLTSSFSLLSFSSPSSFQNLFSIDQIVKQDIDKKTIIRLMGAVSFGYGLFQLGVSLLPPSLTKVVSLLGFGANRDNGIACLMYARLGVDMRAPLATLALLWYHTIVRPFYAVDGTNVKAGLDSATLLLKESEREFSESALFLFFKGRANRLNSDIPSALKSYELAVENATQREIKLLALHEVGWCHLIELDFPNAESVFSYMKTSSRWSRLFYGYLSAICIGAYKPSSQWCLLDEVKAGLDKNNVKIGQLDEFLTRRVKVCPLTIDDCNKIKNIFWKLLVFEMIYLWNSLTSCNFDNIKNIVKDCKTVKNPSDEPMAGMSALIVGACYCILKKNEEAIKSFRECLRIRRNVPQNANDAHVSAFAQFELGNLLLKKEETKNEGKSLLQDVQQYGKYDFEQKLNVRIHYILKKS